MIYDEVQKHRGKIADPNYKKLSQEEILALPYEQRKELYESRRLESNGQLKPSRNLRNHYAEIVKLLDQYDHIVFTTKKERIAVLIRIRDYAKYEEFLHRWFIYSEMIKFKPEFVDPEVKFTDAADVFAKIMQRLGMALSEADYNDFIKIELEKAKAEANNPNTKRLSHEEVMANLTKQRENRERQISFDMVTDENLTDQIILANLAEAEKEAADPNTRWLTQDEVFDPIRKEFGYEV